MGQVVQRAEMLASLGAMLAAWSMLRSMREGASIAWRFAVPIAVALAILSEPKLKRRLTLISPDVDKLNTETLQSQFHDIVAAGSGNPFFEYLMLAFHRITEPSIQRIPFEGDRRKKLVHDHEEIIEAIAAGDRDRATEAMRVDLVEALDHAEEFAPQLLNERIDWGRVNS